MTRILNQTGEGLLVQDGATNVWSVGAGGVGEVPSRGVLTLGTSNGWTATVDVGASGAATVVVPVGMDGAQVEVVGTWGESFLLAFGAVVGMGGLAWSIRIVRRVLGVSLGHGTEVDG